MATVEARVPWLFPYETQEAAELSASRMREVWRKEKGRFVVEFGNDGKWHIYRIYSQKVTNRRRQRSTRLYTRCQKCGALLPIASVWKDAFCDSECYGSYLERRNFLAKNKRERAKWERTRQQKQEAA